jgi:hypothetical protein
MAAIVRAAAARRQFGPPAELCRRRRVEWRPRMARRSKGPVTKAAAVVTYPFRVKSKFEEFIRPAARLLGVAGLAMLVGCFALSNTPHEEWPEGLSPWRLPTYVMVSLAVASLLGWTCVHDGQTRIRRAIGKQISLVLFVAMPITFAYLGLIGAVRVATFGGPGPGHWLWTLVRWYGPACVVASLVSFLSWKSRGRYARGAWFAFLVAPYAVLLAYLVFGFRFPSIDDAHHEALTSLGAWAVALQLTMGYFVGGEK